MYAITRAKKAKTAWYWRVSFKRRGNHHFHTFPDLKHGDSKQALAAAIAWRDRQLRQARVLTLREFHAHRRSNNSSGIAGVHLVASQRQPKGAWQAKIKLAHGKKLTKSFSVKRFGRREAFRRAVAARARMLDLVADRPYLKHATAKKFAARPAAKEKSP